MCCRHVLQACQQLVLRNMSLRLGMLQRDISRQDILRRIHRSGVTDLFVLHDSFVCAQ